jgi:hypothetical protein
MAKITAHAGLACATALMVGIVSYVMGEGITTVFFFSSGFTSLFYFLFTLNKGG